MEVKILCSCGTKYKFDVDDSVRRLTDPINCPACGVEGTAAANDYLAQAPPVAPPQPPAVPASTALRAAPAAPAAGRMIPLPASTGAPPSAAGSKKKRGFGEPNMMLGTVGAVAGAAIGMVVWVFIIKVLNMELGIVAWGVGGLIGFGCRVLGGGYSQVLGLVAGGCALVSIVGGGYLGTRAQVEGYFDKLTRNAYEERVAYAKDAITKSTEPEIREFLSQHETDDDDKPIPADKITAQQITDFRKELPALKELANGKPTKEAFMKELRDEFNSSELQAEIFKGSLSLWTLLWLFLGVGTAWRLGTGEVE